MLRRLFYKLLLQRKKDYLRVILSGSFIIALIFFSASVSGFLVYVTQKEKVTMTELIIEVEKSFLIPYILLLFLMFLILIGYIRKRSVDYTMLITLGIQKKHRYQFIGVEYLGIVLGSFAGGLLFGALGSVFIKRYFEKVFADIVDEIALGWEPLLLTVIIGMMMFFLGFAFCDQLISCMGIEYVLSMGKKSGKAIRSSRIFSLLGAILTVVCMITLVTYWGRLSYTVPTALAVAALILIVLFWGGYYLQRLRTQTKKYYRKILWMDDWYHQFYHHANVSFIIAAFFLVITFGFNLTLIGHLPIVQKDNYPYDLVWGANREDTDFLEELKERYDIRYDTIPSVRVVAGDAGEHTGISVSEYERLTGESPELKDDEIFVVYQEDRSEYGMLGLDYVKKSPRLYIGSSERDIWTFAGLKYLPSPHEFTDRYEVKDIQYRIVTGNFRTRKLLTDKEAGLYSDVFEEMIVFSDSEYEKIKKDARGSNLTVLINIPKQYEEVTDEIYTYAARYSQRNFWDYENGNLIYEKQKEQVIDRQDKLLVVCSMIINMVTLMACMLFTLLENAADEYDNLEWKIRFYFRSGLSEKKRKQVIYREVMLTVKAALAAAFPLTMLLSVVKILYMRMSVRWTGIYFMEVIGILSVISGILLGVMGLRARGYYKRIERRIRDE